MEVKEEKNAYSNLTGYRFMDMEILATVFSLMQCNNCGESNIQLSEISFQRHGCASCLRVLCMNCGWKHTFYTSKKSVPVLRSQQKACLWHENDGSRPSVSKTILWNYEYASCPQTKGIFKAQPSFAQSNQSCCQQHLA